jgi:hypothetical protein
MPVPDVNLQVGSGSHAQQTSQIMCRFESVEQEKRPDLVLVYGDVNSTVAAALVSSKRRYALNELVRLPRNSPFLMSRGIKLIAIGFSNWGHIGADAWPAK